MVHNLLSPISVVQYTHGFRAEHLDLIDILGPSIRKLILLLLAAIDCLKLFG